MATEFEANYERAQMDESYRQEFLDSIDLGEYEPFIARVIYHEVSFLSGVIMKTCPTPTDSDVRAHIYITQNAFEESGIHEAENPYDFINMLKYHEGDHAEKMTSRVLSTTILKNEINDIQLEELERQAYENQLKKMDHRCSPKLRKSIERMCQETTRA